MRTTFLAVVAAFISVAAALPAARLVDAAASPLNDYNYGTDAKGRIAVFARSQADFAKARILIAENVRGRWSAPAPIGFTDDRYSDSDPWLTPDGNTLYFISNRPLSGDKPKADLDIWRSTRSNGRWSTPEHLAAVSSPGPELGVELQGDTLYFSSVRKGGKGGLDIYAARRAGASFEVPTLLHGPFNGPQSDSDFTLSHDGRTAAWWRSIGGKGMLHVARRAGDGWTAPELLPARFNPGEFNFTPSFARDGRHLIFASTALRPGQAAGMADVYIAQLP